MKTAKDFLEQFSPTEFPDEILSEYEPMELLSDNEYTKTFLLLNRTNGKKAVVKCYDKAVYNMQKSDFGFLSNLSHCGLSEFIGVEEDKNYIYVLHEYAEGITLKKYIKSKKPAEKEIINIVSQLCDILDYLHSRKPPVIHRDIKPSNIIINEGKIILIDFGTSRCFNEKLSEDTLCLGTKGFAPPEQYGYSQTDSRADIYAVGALLLYMCSESINLSDVKDLENMHFAEIIKKCTQFSPKDRYKSTSALKDDLLNKNHLGNRLATAAVCVILTCALIFAGYRLFKQDDTLPAVLNNESVDSGAFFAPVQFRSPLIEKAVRNILRKSETEQVTEDELLQIDQLLIAGDKPSSNVQEYYTNITLFYQKDNTIKKGDITDLSDIKKMPNLTTLCLAFQQITDITALKSLEKLGKLELNGNPVFDISALSGLKSLQSISLQETRVANTTPLNTLTDLRYINLNGNRCDSYEFLKYTGDIEYLDLSFAEPEKVLPLLEGKKVKNFQFAYADLYSLSGFEKIKGLETLDVQKSRITEISAIKYISSLTSVNLAENPIENLTPLLSLPNLIRAEFSSDMEAKIKAQLKNAKFDIAYR